MALRFEERFKYFFPYNFDVLRTGILFLIVSLPGLVMIFTHHDVFFESALVDNIRRVGIIWGIITFLIGAGLVYRSARQYSSPGTLTYRITHPRLFSRRS